MENTNTVSGGGLAHPAFNLLLAAGWVALVVTLDRAFGSRLDGMGWARWVHQLGWLSSVIVAVFAWVLFECARHAFRLVRESRVARELGQLPGRRVDASALRRLPAGCRSGERARLIADTAANQRSELSEVVSAVAALEAGALQNRYALCKALVWALPVIGFIGTAAGMAKAIGGFSSALGGSEPGHKPGGDAMVNALVDSLGQVVVPGLAHAFSITMLALGLSLVAHVLLTVLEAWDAELLKRVDEASVKLVAALRDEPQTVSAVPPEAVAPLQQIAAALEKLVTGQSLTHVTQAAFEVKAAAQALRAGVDAVKASLNEPYQITVERGRVSGSVASFGGQFTSTGSRS